MRTLALGLAAALLTTLTGVTTAPATAATEHVLSKSDRWNDARILRQEKGLSKRERRSIDIHGITITRVDDALRLTVRLKKVIRTKKFDQLFGFSMMEQENAEGETWYSDATFRTRGGGWINSAMRYSEQGDRGEETCWVKVKVAPKKGEVHATVPARCAPQHPFKVHVMALTGSLRKDFKFWSFDQLNVGGYSGISVATPKLYQRLWTASRK